MNSSQSISNASYWQYKDDTSYVLKWIEQTAKACGWKRKQAKQTVPDPSTPGPAIAQSSAATNTPVNETTASSTKAAGSGRLKGKERKAAKKKASESAAIEKKKKDDNERDIVFNALDILDQANLISNCLSKSSSSVPRPPSSVMHALGRAIKLRRDFSNWFKIAKPNDHRSNSAHCYFVNVLEKIANLFLKAAETAAVSSNRANTGSTVSGTSSEVNQNRFESLLEQATQDDLKTEPVQSTKSTVPSTAGATTKLGQKYRMEVEDSQENALMVFTLFADLHDIKSEMKSLWKRCFKDGADTVVATLLTAQAIAFVEGLEDSVMSVLGPSKHQHGSAPNKGDQQNRPWSFRGTYCRLLDTLRDPNDAQAIIHFEDSNHTTGYRGKSVNMNNLTFAFTAQRLHKLGNGPCGDPNDDPTDDHFGPYCEPLLLYFKHNPRALLNNELGAAVVERDQNLCCLFAEMAYLDCSSPWQGARQDRSERARRIQSVRKDPIMGSLQPVWTRQEVNLTSVFAAEIMLDIKELSDQFPAGRPSYHATFDKYSTLLGLQADITTTARPGWSTTKDNPFVLGGDTPAWGSKVKVATDKILSMLSIPNPDGVDRPSEQEERREPCREAWDIYRELDTLRLKHTEPDYWDSEVFHFFWLPRDAQFFFDHFTMFGTHREAFMQALTESIGIDILNHGDRQGLGVMAHLFNASRQLGLGNLHWPAMDRLIELHKVALFAGDPPTTPADMLKRFSHRHMGPKRAMSRKQREKIMNRAVTQMKPSAITQALNEHWDTCGRIPFWYTLEANALAEATEKKGIKNDTPTSKQTFVENLPAMEEYLVKQLRDVRVDYLEIARVNAEFNKNLLKHAREVFGKQVNRLLNKEEVDCWSGIDFVSEAFEQEPELHEAMAKCRGDPSKMPIQDCDYLQDSINCLASTLRARGIGLGQTVAADGEGVNMPISLTRFKIRGSEDLPDLGRLVLVHRCACCHRKHYV